MDKTAQKRNWGNKIHENLPSGRVLSKFFDPQFKQVWESLVQKDDTIRSILQGEKLSKNLMPGYTFKDSAKSLLTKAKSYLNQREFISAVSTLSVFHKKMQDVVNIISSFDFDLSKIHHEFLFGKRVPDKDYMDRLSDFEKRIASQQAEFIKQAGLIDSLRNMFSERGRALKSWEKKYEDRVRPIRDNVTRLLESSQQLLDTVLGHLKVMASLRAARKVDAYAAEAKQIQSAFNQYDKGKDGFRNIYNTAIKPLMDEQRRQEAERAAANIPVPTPSGGPTTQNVSPIPQAFQPPPEGSLQTPGSPAIPPPPSTPTNVGEDDPEVVITEHEPEIGSKSDKVFQDIVRQQEEARKAREGGKQMSLFKQQGTKQFIESLEVMSSEDPKIVGAYIAKYARSIQGDDPETAIQLFKLAKSLRG
jgi:hypothetical protein